MQISNTFHLKIDWLMVVMDKFTRRIIGFVGNKGSVTGIDLFHSTFQRLILLSKD